MSRRLEGSRRARALPFPPVCVAILVLTGCMVPGGGGINQTVPDTVRAGEPAVIRLDMMVTDVKWIRGRYKDITLHYRLVGDSAYRSVAPSRRIDVDRGHEAYELSIPPYPVATCGSIEFNVSAKLDGHPNQFEGYRKIRVVPADVRRGTGEADTLMVSACSPAGWTFVSVGTGRAELVRKGGVNVEGIRFVVDTSERSAAHVRTGRFRGTALSQLTALHFGTYVRSQGGIGAPFLIIYIDRDGDGHMDDELRFHPTPAIGVWQTWNALTGQWERAIGRPTDPGEVPSLEAYAAAWPNARLFGDIMVGAWKLGGTRPLDAVVDRVSIGVSDRTTTFLFRP